MAANLSNYLIFLLKKFVKKVEKKPVISQALTIHELHYLIFSFKKNKLLLEALTTPMSNTDNLICCKSHRIHVNVSLCLVFAGFDFLGV